MFKSPHPRAFAPLSAVSVTRPLALLTLLALGAGGCSGVSTEPTGLDVPGDAATPSDDSSPSEGSKASKPDPALDSHQSSAARVPHELIVKFKSETSAAVTSDLASALRERRSLAQLTADGSDSLDRFVGRHKVLEAAPLLSNREGLSLDEFRARLRERTLVPTRLRTAQFSAGASVTAPVSSQGTLSPFEGLLNVYRLQLDEGADLDTAMAELREDPHVEYVHPNYVARLNYTPNDPYFASSGTYGQPRADLWNVKKVRAPLAWDATRGAGVVVAVLDTGVDIEHPDLASNVWTNPGEIAGNGIDDDGNDFIDDIHGWSTFFASADVTDGGGHGTHVAGIIAAQDNNGIGIVGLAPDAKIMPVQVFASSPTGHDTGAFTLSQGLIYAAANGADVINNSWSLCLDGSCPSVPLVEEAVRAAHSAGAVVVLAAGNSGLDIRDFSPQNMPEVIVVGATTPNDTRPDFSNHGLLDISAPGTGDASDPNVVAAESGILSLLSRDCFSVQVCPEQYRVHQQYLRLSGTSFAAPAASAAAALLLALHPEYSPEQVRQVLRRTSFDIGTSGYDPHFGHGRLDVGAIATEAVPLAALIQMPLSFTSNSIPIGGKAHGSQFARYTLEYGAGANPSTWTSLYSSTTPQTSGLYFWRPTLVPDGEYTLRLRAYKTTGAIYEDRHLFTLDRVSLSSPAAFAALPAGDIQLTGSASPGDFRSYAVRVQKLETGASVNANIVLPNGGLSPVLNGTLGVWKTQGLAPGHYRLFLDVTTASGTTTESAVVLVDPLVGAGSPFTVGNYSSFTERPSRGLSVIDLQSDGRPEIVTGWGERVVAFGGDGLVVPGWPQTVTSAQNPYEVIDAAPLVGDIDGDGSKEVVVGTALGTIFVWSASGVLKPGWPRWVADGRLGLSLADVDRNGVLDVVATNVHSGVHVLSGSGSNLGGWPVSLSGVHGPATVADLNKDGRNEVIVSAGTSPNRLYVLNSSGSVQSGWPRTLVNDDFKLTGAHPVVGDMDDDGDLEIVAVGSDDVNASTSRVFVYHHNGQLLSSWSPNAPRVGPPVLGDVDGDGSLEVLASVVRSDGTGALNVWSRSGAALPGWPKNAPVVQGSSPLHFASPIVADIDGDARSEVIVARKGEFSSSDPVMNYGFSVQVYRYDGAVLTSLARPTFGSWFKESWSPALADVDGDAKLELLWLDVREGANQNNALVTSPRVFAWDLSAAKTRAQSWTAERADARSSGVAQNVVPLVRLTQRNTTRRITGLARFVVKAGSGVVQIKHPQGAVVQYAVGSNLLKNTTQGWGEQLNVPANQDVKLRIVTSSAVDVTVDFW